jgi:hypothetical protein
MRAAGRKFVYQPKGVVIHIGGGSASPVVRGEYMRVSREQYYRKRRGPVAALAYHMFITIVAFVGRFLHRERH